MSEVCSKRGCENTRFRDDKYCILHCDKEDFDDQSDIDLFWQKFCEKYSYNTRDELIVENIKFPKFQMDNYSRGYLHSHRNLAYHENVKFIKCTFYNDFNSFYDRYSKTLIFDSCVFYGSLTFRYSQKLELYNCEFKNEFTFENINCELLEINKTLFTKEVRVGLKNDIFIDQDSIFKEKVVLKGNANNRLLCTNSVLLKLTEIYNFKIVVLTNIKINSLEFDEANQIDIKNCYISDIFNLKQNLDTLNIAQSVFRKSLDIIDKTINNIKITNTQFLENVNLSVSNISKLNNGVILLDKNDINITYSQFQELNIDTAHTIIINNSEFNSLYCIGEKYETIELNEIKINNIFESNNVQNLKCNNIFAKYVTTTGIEFKELLLKNFTIENLLFEAKIYKSIHLSDGYYLNNLNIKSDDIKNIDIENVKITFMKVDIVNSSNFNIHSSSLKTAILEFNTTASIELSYVRIYESLFIKSVESNNLLLKLIEESANILISLKSFKNINLIEIECNNLYINALQNIEKNNEDKFFGNDVIIEKSIILNFCLGEVENFKIDSSNINGKTYLPKIKSQLNLIKTNFGQEVDCIDSKFSAISIKACQFQKSVLLNNSNAHHINLDSTTFEAILNFEQASIPRVLIENCDFMEEINFHKNNNFFLLDRFNNSRVKKLNISETEVVGLFHKSMNIKISELVLDNIRLQSFDEKSDIDIRKIQVNDFKCNKLTIYQDINFDDMMIKKLRISNSNIEKVFRIRYSQIEEMFFVDATFEDLQIVDNKNDLEKENRVFRLKNTTIKSTVLDKLRLDNFNMSDAHVSDAKIGYVKFQQGSRETNRFFKNYYDSISDYIKANEYYKDEMEEQYKISKGSEKIVLFFNKHISNFGQSWLKPLGWIIFFSIVFYSIMNLDYFMIDGYILNHKGYIWNNFWQFLNPFAKNASQEYMDWYWLWMIHKLFLSAFIYHFIIAVKRRTKR